MNENINWEKFDKEELELRKSKKRQAEQFKAQLNRFGLVSDLKGWLDTTETVVNALAETLFIEDSKLLDDVSYLIGEAREILKVNNIE